jgi:hypothetical protein
MCIRRQQSPDRPPGGLKTSFASPHVVFRFAEQEQRAIGGRLNAAMNKILFRRAQLSEHTVWPAIGLQQVLNGPSHSNALGLSCGPSRRRYFSVALHRRALHLSPIRRQLQASIITPVEMLVRLRKDPPSIVLHTSRANALRPWR